ncbi:response regulator [Sphingomonas sp. SRS2]|uniref:response regulator n=1 Tax=Sphingomonas sp. SRS2 TaxID=133190 RepID=UPI000698EFBD|nr:response regulator [Sphingomonas sp. SRS2]
MHALVIEDEPMIAMLVEDYLTDLGYATVTVVSREQEAIAAAVEMCPDIIVADEHILEGSGIAAVQEICADQVIPTIYSMGLVDANDIDELLPYAAVASKPYTFAVFQRAVQDATMKARAFADRTT